MLEDNLGVTPTGGADGFGRDLAYAIRDEPTIRANLSADLSLSSNLL
jgi:hypothetical protein